MSSTVRLARALVVLLTCLALGCGSCAMAQAAVPIAVGVNIGGAPGGLAALRQYVRIAGRRPAIVMWYEQWSEPLAWPTQLPNTEAIGAVPMITWDPIVNGNGIPLSQIVAGQYDNYIRSSAAAAASWGRPIYIRFGHEMNLPGSPFAAGRNGNTPAVYIAAWRHVVTLFRQAGADNVEWVWSPNADCAGKCPFTAFYPGNAWVDWVALDGYNYASLDHTPWLSFDEVFGGSYSTLTRLSDKPVMIAETATSGSSRARATWIRRAFFGLPSRFPRIRAIVWFDRVKETDWRVNSSRLVLRAWRAVVHARAYSGTAASLLRTAPLAGDVTRPPGLA